MKSTTTSAASTTRVIPSVLDQFESRLFRIEHLVCVVSLLIMLLTVSLSVVVRYFNLGLPNVAEWAIVAMSPLTFVGAAMCTYAQSHISVDVVKLLRHPGARRTARGLVALCLLVFAGVYAWIGTLLFTHVLGSGERLIDMGTPVYVPVFFVMAGMVLMLVHAAMELWRVLRNEAPVSVDLMA